MSDQSHRIHRHNYESFFTVFSNALWENEYLSWASKSLLAYMLSRPSNWVVYRGQLASIYKGDKRGNGKDAVDSCFQELIELGFIVYTPKDEKTGKFIHRYDVYPEPVNSFKEKIPETVKPPTGKTPSGLNSPQTRNDSLTSNEGDNNKPPAAAVFSCLKNKEIPQKEKEWITKIYSEEIVKQAIAYTEDPQTKIRTSYIQTLKWACETQPEPPEVVDAESNKGRSKQFIEPLGNHDENWEINVLPQHVEILPILDKKNRIKGKGIYFNYEKKSFRNDILDFFKEKIPSVYQRLVSV